MAVQACTKKLSSKQICCRTNWFLWKLDNLSHLYIICQQNCVYQISPAKISCKLNHLSNCNILRHNIGKTPDFPSMVTMHGGFVSFLISRWFNAMYSVVSIKRTGLLNYFEEFYHPD